MDSEKLPLRVTQGPNPDLLYLSATLLGVKLSRVLSRIINFTAKAGACQKLEMGINPPLSVRPSGQRLPRRVFGCDRGETDQPDVVPVFVTELDDDAAVEEKLNAVDNKLSRKSGKGEEQTGLRPTHRLTCCLRLHLISVCGTK